MKFSIITCAHNSEKYVHNNINSIKSQKFKDFEHIFIDGFSKDRTMHIINKYQKQYPNKVKIFQFPAQGIADAMNKGIEKAQGQYLIHLHSDDYFDNKEVLEEVSRFLKKNNNPDWIFGKAIFINTETKKSRVVPHRSIYHKARFWLLLLTNYINHQTVFIKKEVFQKYGFFDKNLSNNMDYEMWLRLTKNQVKSKFINRIICHFTVRPDSQSTIGISGLEDLILIDRLIKNNLLNRILKLIHRINGRRKLV